jgi:hypothetical protein
MPKFRANLTWVSAARVAAMPDEPPNSASTYYCGPALGQVAFVMEGHDVETRRGSGRPYQSFVFLLEELSRPRAAKAADIVMIRHSPQIPAGRS